MLVYIFITMGIPYYFSYLIKNHSAINDLEFLRPYS